MNIIYPPLVEQMHEMLKKQGIEKPITQVYKEMIEHKMITETGEPTEEALNNGYAKMYQQKHNRLIDFKKEYPIFMSYPKDEFTQQAGIWYVSQRILSDVEEKMNNDRFGCDEMQQISVYMSYRNYDNPSTSTAEMKGCFHPLYTPYDDSLFLKVDGIIKIPESVVLDIIRRCECGEIEVNDYELNSLKRMIEEE
jgi:hypothetical protein